MSIEYLYFKLIEFLRWVDICFIYCYIIDTNSIASTFRMYLCSQHTSGAASNVPTANTKSQIPRHEVIFDRLLKVEFMNKSIYIQLSVIVFLSVFFDWKTTAHNASVMKIFKAVHIKQQELSSDPNCFIGFFSKHLSAGWIQLRLIFFANCEFKNAWKGFRHHLDTFTKSYKSFWLLLQMRELTRNNHMLEISNRNEWKSVSAIISRFHEIKCFSRIESSHQCSFSPAYTKCAKLR
jgi:hypothetical protein